MFKTDRSSNRIIQMSHHSGNDTLFGAIFIIFCVLAVVTPFFFLPQLGNSGAGFMVIYQIFIAIGLGYFGLEMSRRNARRR